MIKQDGSLGSCYNIWDIFIGQFESNNKKPFKKFEQKYMRLKKWKYSTLQSDLVLRSGFVEKLASQQRREKLKIINLTAKNARGTTFGISRPSDMIDDATRYKKRKKGICVPEYMIKRTVRK